MARPGGKEVGRVSIRVLPDATKFRNDLKLLLKRVEGSMSANLSVRADTRAAEAQIRRLQKDWNGKSISMDVDLKKDLVSQRLALMSRPRDVEFRPQIAAASAAKIATFFAGLSGARLAGDAVTGLARQLGGLDRSLPKIAAVGFAISALSSVLISGVGGAGAFAVALSQLAGIAALLPAALGAAGFSVVTLLTAFKGVGAALKQVTGGGGGGGGGGGASLAQQARALQSAEASLTRAQVAAKDAQENLTQAREDAVKALRDLSNNVTDAQLSERQSVLDLQQAQADYESVMADPSATERQREQAAITFEQAKQGLTEQRQRVEDLRKEQAAANAAGVEGAANVRQATQQLADAQQGVVDAQSSILNLQEQNAAAGAATADAMAALTPAAQSAVRALAKVWDMLGNVRATVQENFFAGFSEPLLALANTIIPQLQSGMGAIASQLGGVVQGLMGALNGALGGGVLDSMLQATATGIANLGPGIQPLVDALVTLGTVGVQYLPAMGTALSSMADQFSTFISAAAESGDLQGWIQTAIDGFAQVGSIVGSLFRIFTGLFASLGDSSPLATFAGFLQRVADVINTPVFQTALQTLFDGAAAGAAGLASALGPIGNLIGTAAPLLASFLANSGALIGDVLTKIADGLSTPQAQAGISAFFDGLLAGVAALEPAIPALVSAFSAVAQFAGDLAAQLGPVLGATLIALAPVLGNLLTALEPILPILGATLIQAVQELGPAFADFMVALVPLLPYLADLAANLLPFLVIGIKALLPVLAFLLKPSPMYDFVMALLGVGKGFLSMVLALQNGATLAGTILQALQGAFGSGIQRISQVISGFSNGVQAAFGAIGGFIRSAFDGALSAVRGPVNGIIGLVNDAIRGLNGLKVTIPSWVPLVGGQTWGINLPTIPSLALGATILPTPGGTIVRAGEGGRAESVVDTGLLNKMLAANLRMTERANPAGGEGVTLIVPTTQNQDPRILARVLGREFLDTIAGG